MFVAASLPLREAVVPPEIGPALPCAAAFAGWCSVKSLWPRGPAQGLGICYQRQSKLDIQLTQSCLPAWSALVLEPGTACAAEQGRKPEQ